MTWQFTRSCVTSTAIRKFLRVIWMGFMSNITTNRAKKLLNEKGGRT